MNIAISLNHKYVKYAYVMLTSLYLNNDKGIVIFAMENDLNEDDKKLLDSLAEKYLGEIVFIHIDKADYSNKLPVTSEWSLETYFRLQMIDLLPKEVEKLLYIDIDVIINKSISELYDMEFGDKLFVACPDTVTRPPFSDKRDTLFEHIKDEMCYFNAGIMLWNIGGLRKEGYSFDFYMNLAKELDYQMLAPDQDLLNLAHYNRVEYADSNKYDFFARFGHSHGVTYEEVKEAVNIVHYAGYKPWSGEFVHYDIEQLWWDYAKKTPLYNELLEDFLSTSLFCTTVEDTLNNVIRQKDEYFELMNKATGIVNSLMEKLK